MRMSLSFWGLTRLHPHLPRGWVGGLYLESPEEWTALDLECLPTE